jgi:hypothetical protein
VTSEAEHEAFAAGLARYTQDQARHRQLAEAVKADFAPDAPDAVVAYFLRVAQHRGLDPWAGEIALVPRRNRQTGEVSWHYEVTVDGRRTIAQRTGRLEGIEGPAWCGPRRYSDAGDKLPLDWLELWDDDDGPPYAARCLVHVNGWKVPANGTVKWSEFAGYLDADREKLGPFWRKSPSHMLGVRAECLALRRGFREVLDAVHDENVPLGQAAAPIEQVPEHVYDDAPESRGYDQVEPL